MSQKKVSDKKSRILKVAEEVFAEVGYDGARVDDIAKRAEVNKALIYYYFQSKEDILNTLLTNLMEDTKKMVGDNLKGISIKDIDDDFESLINVFLDFLSERKNIIKVALSESLKSNSKNSIILKIASLLMDAEIENIRKATEKKGIKFPQKKQQMLVMEFFTGVMPILNFVIYKDQWKEYYDINEDELKKYFLKVFKETHIAYHMSKL
ncbi:TetR/AcrR family transcriptional regulator [Thermohalobacter berrensis]|uniref:TetR family transcriptional regulator n=1 Tax=Thermohalobacter berrensis TaxID=99594 RepID=A0A419T8Y5_9FIRM|nr:TetR/AcrR family transcriptional regulator [Thermohalobacter berrensis]RKD33928.1 TetR family transcriptional regulator [Thermohalobacter berrensis]